MQIAAAIIATPGGRICDVGGNASIYNLVAALLGTEVSVIDHVSPVGTAVDQLERIKSAGVKFEIANIFQFDGKGRDFDGISAFETIEHFPHSPRPALMNMIDALRAGGRLCLSVPNIARIDFRIRAIMGRTVHERYAGFFRTEGEYPGHHREYTMSEMRWLAEELQLGVEKIFAVNCTYESKKRKSPAQRFLLNLEEMYGLGDFLLPPTLRHHIWMAAVPVERNAMN
jgi:2-polyprenyl-3-methyl-5-hydroxy-6-metoxy-1,4-benzoquinol methylase